MNLRPRRRHSRRGPVIRLTPREARTAYLACRDAEDFRRWSTRTPCSRCRADDTGVCARHFRDLNLADGYARLRVQLGSLLPQTYSDRGELLR
jgi:hypothetical protein